MKQEHSKFLYIHNQMNLSVTSTAYFRDNPFSRWMVKWTTAAARYSRWFTSTILKFIFILFNFLWNLDQLLSTLWQVKLMVMVIWHSCSSALQTSPPQSRVCRVDLSTNFSLSGPPNQWAMSITGCIHIGPTRINRWPAKNNRNFRMLSSFFLWF